MTEISILDDFALDVYALHEKLLKPLMLIYGSQTNLSQKHLTNENFLGGLSKCGRYMLDFLDF